MSKVSFRARQIDFNKPLPILKNGSDLFAEFSENSLVNRGVPQIPSGMEKEEENEHHFVEVIHALQLRDESYVKIPVPDIVDRYAFYQKTYPENFTLPKQLVHIRSVVLAEHDNADYDMDTDDEEWLSKSKLDIDPGRFESMIDRLERGCGQRVMNLEEAKYLLQEDPSLVIAVYDYWLNKRVQSRQPLLFSVRQEKRDNNSNADPYVAFRRRSEKMQTRKNRKNDEHSYEKMLLLRGQMNILGEIMSRLVKREMLKEELVRCERRTFETRYQLSDWDGICLIEAETQLRKPQRVSESTEQRSPKGISCKRQVCKRKFAQRPEDASELEHKKSSVDEPFPFIRMQGCRYLKPRYFVYLHILAFPAALFILVLSSLLRSLSAGLQSITHRIGDSLRILLKVISTCGFWVGRLEFPSGSRISEHDWNTDVLFLKSNCIDRTRCGPQYDRPFCTEHLNKYMFVS